MVWSTAILAVQLPVRQEVFGWIAASVVVAIVVAVLAIRRPPVTQGVRQSRFKFGPFEAELHDGEGPAPKRKRPSRRKPSDKPPPAS